MSSLPTTVRAPDPGRSPGAPRDRDPLLMLVSATARHELRGQVASGLRPTPEFLVLEKAHGVHLLDRPVKGRRSASRSLAHVARALPRVRPASAVLSDGEHLGIPLALAMMGLRAATPHVVIGHHLSTPVKAPLFRWLNVQRGIDRIIVHSSRQRDLLIGDLGLDPSVVHLLAYGVDTSFWSPRGNEEAADLVLSVGSEHRDYRSLLDACPEPIRLFVASNSPYAPDARRRAPTEWPARAHLCTPSWVELRDLYDRAAVVVVPLVPTDFPAGITALLEAMSMAKAVVVSATEGLEGLLDDRSAILVPPGDVERLGGAIERLLADPGERQRLGQAARRLVLGRYGVERYASELARHLEEVALSRSTNGGRW